MKKKLFLNTITSILLQVTTLICGFVLPRLILEAFGSNVNGLVSSISQFLSLITFLELGVGAVVQSALYKPLLQNDTDQISAIVTSGDKFFKRIAYILSGYILVLVVFNQLIFGNEFDWIYTALLIVAISISSFAQYYFGIVDRIVLVADQCGYIQYLSQILTLVANTLVCVILIKLNFSIQVVKLVASGIHLVRPIILRLYVNRHYNINRKYNYSVEPIKQKWNGIAQHVAHVIIEDTDTIVLTLFSTLSNVSIYAVYNMVTLGIKNLYYSASHGVQALVGRLWVEGNKSKFREFFDTVEFTLHSLVVFLYSCTGILLVPFIRIYTLGITDANYIQPVFAILITAAHAWHCLRVPYNIVVLAAGKYKETQSSYIISALINLSVSIVSVWQWGLIGVAVGTVASMLFHTVWLAFYTSKNLIDRSLKLFLKRCVVDLLCLGLIIFSTRWLSLSGDTYIAWGVMAIEVAVIAFVEIVIISCIFYMKEVKKLLAYFSSKTK